MMAASRRLRYSNFTLYGSLSGDCSSALPPFSTKLLSFTSRNDSHEDDRRTSPNTDRRTPPEPIPNRPLRAGQAIYQSEQNLPFSRSHGRGGHEKSTATINNREPFRFDKLGDDAERRRNPRFSQPKSSGFAGENQGRGGLLDELGDDEGENTKQRRNLRFSQQKQSGFAGENQGRGLLDNFGIEKEENTKRQQNPRFSQPKPFGFAGDKQGHDFLEKFKLGFDKGEKQVPGAASSEKEEEGAGGETKAAALGADDDEKLHPPPDADEIFKKLKETGLIPNAVAMLDGLCKDGLVQEAMKLFGLMREKGTIPEVVIYTAVVEGFCKAQKLDDAKRIFLKMKGNGISPNAFSYAVLIRGLCKGKRLEDAVEVCVEMLDAGHSPNLATFAGLVDAFCREKGLEEAQSAIRALIQKGFCFDEKLVREFLDKKGPFLPVVWEAIFGKKSSERLF